MLLVMTSEFQKKNKKQKTAVLWKCKLSENDRYAQVKSTTGGNLVMIVMLRQIEQHMRTAFEVDVD